jgi:hypothetical protein
MNAIAMIRQWLSGLGFRGLQSGRKTSALSWTVRIAGIVTLVAGLQTWGFYRHVIPLADRANENLVLLREEAPGNQLINATLNVLRDYRRISGDEVRQRQILELRDAAIQRFADNPRLAIDEAARVTAGFEAQTAVEEEFIGTLQHNFLRLQNIYSDHYAVAITAYSDPPWYLQPTATLLTMDRSTAQKLDYDRALYLMLVGDRSAANSIYNDLRQNARSEVFKSRVLLAQARLQYDAFRIENDPEYYRQAVQHVQQSLSYDAAYDLPKLFLEYLLTMSQQAMEMDSAPLEGQGSGESQGERGAISTDPTEF